ncbi:DUF6207 family protein [Streptomyces sp. NPDC056112]|uniref:DUF6207 family protein n=1 Tax=Streptomyces sp. NPDC056112 TaxID=3345715 RepID=UPI0035E18798
MPPRSPSSNCRPVGGRTALAQHTTRDVGEPGVRLRCNLDPRQPLGPAAPDEPVSAAAPR